MGDDDSVVRGPPPNPDRIDKTGLSSDSGGR